MDPLNPRGGSVDLSLIDLIDAERIEVVRERVPPKACSQPCSGGGTAVSAESPEENGFFDAYVNNHSHQVWNAEAGAACSGDSLWVTWEDNITMAASARYHMWVVLLSLGAFIWGVRGARCSAAHP
jgi:hypothetical protein